MKKLLIEFWQGQRPLWQAFWLLFVLGQILILLISAFIFWVFIEGPFQNIFSVEVSVIPSGMVWLTFILYASLSVWRCAKITKMAVWTWSSRIFIIAYLIRQVYGVYEVWTYWVPRLKAGL
ncbi:MAG: hypothetical protein JRI53_00125 [Deltaproteobacteria bacterium]|nr:hypothetical protein [Deltaproteobacteria bacterium]MBW1983098.1 hypothetical protein [Deltaproteobacteria bacterium]MBW2181103.1 hypothetical protein [Deltaproteobacteria bacterium]